VGSGAEAGEAGGEEYDGAGCMTWILEHAEASVSS
jgi:hypothetical protein